MPPQLALLLCTVFVIFLLRLDRRMTHNVSHILWIPTIWMLSISSKPWGVWLGNEGGTVETGSPVDRIFLSGLLCLGLLILALKNFAWSRVIKDHPWLMLLISYMLVSTLWSSIPYISFKRWVREMVPLVMAFLILTEKAPSQALERLIRRTIYILIPYSVLLVKYFTEYGCIYGRWSGELMWIGVTTQKNGLGRLCIISGFFLVWTLIKRWKERNNPISKYQNLADVSVLIMALWLLKGPGNSYSATSLVVFVVGLATFIKLLRMRKRQQRLGKNILSILIIAIMVYGFSVPIIGGLTIGDVSSDLGRDETLTGRTDVWKELVPVAMKNPILGYGFGGFWTTETHEVFSISGAHNGYLDVWLELGVVGLLFLLMYLLSVCRKAQMVMAYDYYWGSLCICYLFMALFHNITESSFAAFSTQIPASLLFLAISFKVPSNTTKEFDKKYDI